MTDRAGRRRKALRRRVRAGSACSCLIGLAVLSLAGRGGDLADPQRRAGRSRPIAGPWSLKETDRLTTGQQRVDRVAFATGGDCLAGICPRYNRLLIYQVDAAKKLWPIAETELEGRPVGVVSLGSRFARAPAAGRRREASGARLVGGLRSRGEADRLADHGGLLSRTTSRPRPTADSCSSSARAVPKGTRRSRWRRWTSWPWTPRRPRSRLLGRVTFDASDDPERVTLSASSRYAAVLLAKSKAIGRRGRLGPVRRRG